MASFCSVCDKDITFKKHHSGEIGKPICCECAHPTVVCPYLGVSANIETYTVPSGAWQTLPWSGERGASIKTDGETGQVPRPIKTKTKERKGERMAIDEKKPKDGNARIMVEYGKWGKIYHIYDSDNLQIALQERKAVKLARQILKIVSEGGKRNQERRRE